ncbi:hypothetical protein T265_13967, partial [Opisthorchis viverrini]
WLERELTDRKARGSNPACASRLPLSGLAQLGSIPALVPPSCGMATRHQRGATAGQFTYIKSNMDDVLDAHERTLREHFDPQDAMDNWGQPEEKETVESNWAEAQISDQTGIRITGPPYWITANRNRSAVAPFRCLLPCPEEKETVESNWAEAQISDQTGIRITGPPYWITANRNRSAVAPFRCLTAMPLEICTGAGILPGYPSLDRGNREAEVRFEPRTFRSVDSCSNHLGYLVPIYCQYVTHVTKLIGTMWDEEKVPAEWGKSTVIPVFKKGRRTLCKNHRGISLLAVASKVLSGLILRRLAEPSLTENQAGFRPVRCCIDHIFTLRQILEQ